MSPAEGEVFRHPAMSVVRAAQGGMYPRWRRAAEILRCVGAPFITAANRLLRLIFITRYVQTLLRKIRAYEGNTQETGKCGPFFHYCGCVTD